jgi:hypothetical protein
MLETRWCINIEGGSLRSRTDLYCLYRLMSYNSRTEFDREWTTVRESPNALNIAFGISLSHSITLWTKTTTNSHTQCQKTIVWADAS